MNPNGSKHSFFSVQNDLDGAIILAKRIVDATNNNTIDNVGIGNESTDLIIKRH